MDDGGELLLLMGEGGAVKLLGWHLVVVGSNMLGRREERRVGAGEGGGVVLRLRLRVG